MKIAVFYNLVFGGAKRVVKDQVEGLSDAGHSVDVYTIDYQKDFFDPKPFSNKHYNYKFENFLVKLPLIGRATQVYNALFLLKDLQKEIAQDIDKRNYDIVLVHPDRYVQAPYVLRFLKTKTVYYCQEPYRNAYEHMMRINESIPPLKRLFEHIYRYLIKVADRKNVKSATFTIASCNHIRERMVEAYSVFPHVVSPGIDTKIFKPMNSRKKSGVLFVGSKTDIINGFDLLEKAINLIPIDKRPQLQFVTWKKNNKERITEKELAEIYSKSKVTACMSKLETFGLIPLESMACGTPVVAINAGGHRETVIHNKTGILTDYDPQKIAGAIINVFEIKNYKKISEEAVFHVRKNWDIEIKNKELEQLLNELIVK